MSNKVYYGDGCVYDLSPHKTGINSNGIGVGPSGSGKTAPMIELVFINKEDDNDE